MIDADFSAVVEPLRGALRLHCYRMLGSSHDSDDLVQETFLRAWRARASLDDPARLRPWLYRIATNACLDELRSRPRRALASDVHPASSHPEGPLEPPIDEPVWLEPMPSAWLGAEPDDPAARYTLKESVALAFVAALQVLSPPQRATLLLRDVIGLSADEAAGALGVTVSAANSALHRARVTIEEKVVPGEIAPTARDRETAARYLRALDEANVDGLIELLRDDVITTMPPRPMWIAGGADNARFYRHMFSERGHGPGRALGTAANGAPALGFYHRFGGETLALRAIQAIAVRDGAVARIDHFMLPAVLPLFDLPATLP